MQYRLILKACDLVPRPLGLLYGVLVAARCRTLIAAEPQFSGGGASQTRSMMVGAPIGNPLLQDPGEVEASRICWGSHLRGTRANCTPGFCITKANKFVGKFCPR